jgi:hypothetical protein
MAECLNAIARKVLFETSAWRSRYIIGASRIEGLVASHTAKCQLIAQNPPGRSHMLACWPRGIIAAFAVRLHRRLKHEQYREYAGGSAEDRRAELKHSPKTCTNHESAGITGSCHFVVLDG